MKKVLTAGHAASWGAGLSRVKMIGAHPIALQTRMATELTQACGDHGFDARFLRMESEQSAMAAIIAAQTTGLRSFITIASNRLAQVNDLLHRAAHARLPMVMVTFTRALKWTGSEDQSAFLTQRDTGWIQIHSETNQEVLDSIIQAYRIAETVSLPVMICYDDFFLTHPCEPVDLPDQNKVDRVLPPYAPEFFLDTENPKSFYSQVMPENVMDIHYHLQLAHETALSVIDETGTLFGKIFGRPCKGVETIECEDARIILVTLGTMTRPARQVLRDMREKGHKIGLLKIKIFRPFPVKAVQAAVKDCQKIIVVDQNISWGKGGILADEVKTALSPLPAPPLVYAYIAGLGSRPITLGDIREIIYETMESDAPQSRCVWKG